MKSRKITIVSNEKDFLRNYLKIIRPISKLTESEERVLIVLEWLCRMQKTTNLFKIVKSNKPIICEKLEISEKSLASILSTIRKKRAIVDNEFNPSLILFNDEYKYEDLNLNIQFKHEQDI